MATLRCKEPFSADIKGVAHVISAGQLLDSRHPIVKGREHLFEPVEAFMERRTAQVEQATAEPGVKRSALRRNSPSVQTVAANPEPKAD